MELNRHLLRIAFCLLASTSAVAAGPTDVWLDVDTSTGVQRERPRDVDDGLAMIQAFNSPELIVRGVSVVFGNADLDEAVPLARQIAARFGPAGLGVFAGAASRDDRKKETDATLAMAAALRERPLVLIALGPVTNVAGVVERHPELKGQIRHVVVVAGRRPGFNFHPPERPELIFPDANFEKDVQGMQVLLDSGIPIVFAGYEVSSDVWLRRSDLESLARRSDTGKWIAETSDYWLTRWETKQKLPGFNPFDSLGVSHVSHPDLIQSIRVEAHITSGPNDRASGRLPATRPTKPYLLAEPSADGRHLYCTSVDPAYTALLCDRLAARPATTAEAGPK